MYCIYLVNQLAVRDNVNLGLN